MINRYIVIKLLLILLFIPSLSTGQIDELDEQADAFFRNNKLDSKDDRGAIIYYTKAIELNSNSSNNYFNRGLHKANLKDYVGAIKDFTKTIELRYDNNDSIRAWDAYDNRGVCKIFLEDHRGAINDFTKALELKPNGGTYSNRGRVRFRLKQLNSACMDFRKALKLGYSPASILIKNHCN